MTNIANVSEEVSGSFKSYGTVGKSNSIVTKAKTMTVETKPASITTATLSTSLSSALQQTNSTPQQPTSNQSNQPSQQLQQTTNDQLSTFTQTNTNPNPTTTTEAVKPTFVEDIANKQFSHGGGGGSGGGGGGNLGATWKESKPMKAQRNRNISLGSVFLNQQQQMEQKIKVWNQFEPSHVLEFTKAKKKKNLK